MYNKMAIESPPPPPPLIIIYIYLKCTYYVHMSFNFVNIITGFFWQLYCQRFNSLGPRNAIWRWRSWSTLVKVMACCLTAPSYYLNRCWLIISKVMWHSSEDIIKRRFEDTNQESKIENYIFKIILRSPRGQWVKRLVSRLCPVHSPGHCWSVR